MTSHTSSPDAVSAPRSRLRGVALLLAAAVAAVIVNALIANLAVAAGAPSDYGPLTLPAYALFTVLGIAAGWWGWTWVRRRAADPRRTLSILVPVVLVASFVPDVLLLVFRFIPGTTVPAVLALMAMHLVVAAVAVPAYLLASNGHGRSDTAPAHRPGAPSTTA